ncbi:MAG: effector binding domain-containing protein [Oscillospiraceae bacterium]|nr:effector binding domain-containing protein [Oscillospiraceae bacterium]
MNTLTITQVTKLYDVTPRMLRHYEKLGLITPCKSEDYAYRLYDEAAIRRLQQIIILRKLRFSLKQIAAILQDNAQQEALQIMRDSIAELDSEIDSLSKVRSIIGEFANLLDLSLRTKMSFDLLKDETITEVIDTLSLSKSTLKEKYSMNDLEKANDVLNHPENVRIVLLPPFTVASFHQIGKNPEESDEISDFIRESQLYEIKPDARFFGFNHPNPGVRDDGLYGYEQWVTIPDDEDIQIPLPPTLTKKHFEGGLYAALTIKFPEFHRWNDLVRWVNESDRYEANYSELGDEIMGGCLEEHLNWVYSAHMGWPENGIDGQLDLLLPIKPK